jgi:ribonuclease HII
MFENGSMWTYEKKAASSGFFLVAGVDEAGRGPLAGPVVSAAVILPVDFPDVGVNDSKKLSHKKRERLYDIIHDQAIAIGVGIADHDEIDAINILQASIQSMIRAVDNLEKKPDYLLVDGINYLPKQIPQSPIKKGDSLSISIAAASIIAKVTRDRLMNDYDKEFPQYGFSIHKGYPTRFHREAIIEFGPCLIHRKSFTGVKEYI